ncbi:O-antigen polysaccharide polymerase Wzy [Clostridium estertheticum]|uniref:O-antigen polysaccharide polymerase Wzy n=1 Tax=Clostridium estertheticum TaxID=238834 RepID=A0A7Y3T0W3_9CLOT|nr:O-antigen polysaccharide polymerase Wzy [Clostridium estertheticum]NNU77314.1 O-antigen polysaccharide polymerase Wzy [Clostridium estertheticum]
MNINDKNKNKIKNLNYIYIYILILLSLYFISSISISNSMQDDIYINIFTGLSVFILVINVLSYYQITQSFFGGYNIYLIIGYFFWNGQSLLKLLNIDEKYYRSLLSIDNTSILKAELYLCLFLTIFHLGALVYIYFKPNCIIKLSKSKIEISMYNKSIRIVALLLMITSAFFYFDTLVQNAIISSQMGYGRLYNYDQIAVVKTSIENIFEYLAAFFVPGLILLYISTENQKHYKYLNLLFMVIIALNLVAGTRNGAVILIVVLLWLRHNFYKEFKNLKIFIIVFFIGIFLITILNTISLTRNMQQITIDYFIGIFMNNLTNENPIIKLISDMGNSGLPLIWTMDLVPSIFHYKLGLSYLASFLAIIPSLLLNGFSLTQEANLAEWLMKVKNMNYGPGYSLVAELYYNFGWMMSFMGLFLGAFFCKMLYYNKKEDKLKSILNGGFVAIFMYISLMSSRDSLYLIIRNSFYLILLPGLVIKLVYAMLSKFHK